MAKPRSASHVTRATRATYERAGFNAALDAAEQALVDLTRDLAIGRDQPKALTEEVYVGLSHAYQAVQALRSERGGGTGR